MPLSPVTLLTLLRSRTSLCGLTVYSDPWISRALPSLTWLLLPQGTWHRGRSHRGDAASFCLPVALACGSVQCRATQPWPPCDPTCVLLATSTSRNSPFVPTQLLRVRLLPHSFSDGRSCVCAPRAKAAACSGPPDRERTSYEVRSVVRSWPLPRPATPQVPFFIEYRFCAAVL